MRFSLTNSFDENMSIFRAEAEGFDADCARILFDNLETLCRDGDAARNREAIREFHAAVLTAVDNMHDPRNSDET